MHLPCLAKPPRSWPFALALSLLLHGCLALVLGFLSSQSGLSENRAVSSIDTRALSPAMEVSLVLYAAREADRPDDCKGEIAGCPARAPLGNLQTRNGNLDAVGDRELPASFTMQAERKQEASAMTGRTGILPRHPAGTSGKGEDTTTFFQIATQGKAIVYVIDRSASMGLNGGLARAKRELVASLDRLPSTSRFQIIAYNRSAEPLRINGESGLVFATPENRRSVALALEGMEAEGSTEHLPALRRALALGPEVIFFLTDADDLRAEHLRAITSLNHGRTVIHTIELGRASRAKGDVPLDALAQANGGRYQSVPLSP
jgi:hypothetical protein